MHDSESRSTMPATAVRLDSLREAVTRTAREKYLELFGEDAPRDETADLSELRWDSFQATRYVQSLSAAFGVRLPLKAALQTLTLAGIVDAVVRASGLGE
jgi:acyl carrier protein